MRKSYNYKIEIFDKGKTWYWRMSSCNGRILAHSEQYKTKRACTKIAFQLEDDLIGCIVYVNNTRKA